MNSFAKKEKANRLKEISERVVSNKRVALLSNAFKSECSDFLGLSKILSKVKETDINLDLIFALSFNRLMNISYKERQWFLFMGSLCPPKNSNYFKTLSKYNLHTNFPITTYGPCDFNKLVSDFWLNTFCKTPGYNKYFAADGLFYKDAVLMIPNFNELSEKIKLQQDLQGISAIKDESIKAHKI